MCNGRTGKQNDDQVDMGRVCFEKRHVTLSSSQTGLTTMLRLMNDLGKDESQIKWWNIARMILKFSGIRKSKNAVKEVDDHVLWT